MTTPKAPSTPRPPTTTDALHPARRMPAMRAKRAKGPNLLSSVAQAATVARKLPMDFASSGAPNRRLYAFAALTTRRWDRPHRKSPSTNRHRMGIFACAWEYLKTRIGAGGKIWKMCLKVRQKKGLPTMTFADMPRNHATTARAINIRSEIGHNRPILFEHVPTLDKAWPISTNLRSTLAKVGQTSTEAQVNHFDQCWQKM